MIIGVPLIQVAEWVKRFGFILYMPLGRTSARGEPVVMVLLYYISSAAVTTHPENYVLVCTNDIAFSRWLRYVGESSVLCTRPQNLPSQTKTKKRMQHIGQMSRCQNRRFESFFFSDVQALIFSFPF